MKKLLLLVCVFFTFQATSGQTQEQKIENLESFAKVYGYVKYFHPTDEAYRLDWDKFAIYGAQKVMTCTNQMELQNTLKELFAPVAPTIQITNSKAALQVEEPEDNDCEYTYWQHLGLGFDATSGGNVYQSSRVGAMMDPPASSGDFANLMTSVDVSEMANKYMKITAHVKILDEYGAVGRLWLREDTKGGGFGFFDNMGDRPIEEGTWNTYSIEGQMGQQPDRLVMGALLIGEGAMAVDNFKLYFRDSESDQWQPYELHNGSFESDQIGDDSGQNNKWSTYGAAYSFDLADDSSAAGKQSVYIKSTAKAEKVKGKKLFKTAPKGWAVFNSEIGQGLYAHVPLTVCIASDGTTYPSADGDIIDELSAALRAVEIDAGNLSTRLGNIINTYNVFHHFFPYFDQIDSNWDAAFTKALNSSFEDQDAADHLQTLKELTAQLKDGHVRVNLRGTPNTFAPPFAWEVVQDQLVVTKVFEEASSVQVGDVITSVDGKSTSEFLADVYKGISSGTVGWRNYRASTESMLGEQGSAMTLQLEGGKEVIIARSVNLYQNYQKYSPERVEHKKIGANSYYVHIGVASMETINALMPELEAADGLIFDLRGYPNGNHDLISHLLSKKDSNEWMFIPEITIPNRTYMQYRASGWNMPTKKPYLGDKKVVFIIDGSAISYAESYMGFIKGYNLATIVGQPTAGANGNVNRTNLPGGFSISWTGMRVLQHNGDQHHAVGVQPDVFVEKTIEGVQQGRDEFLEKALEIIGEK